MGVGARQGAIAKGKIISGSKFTHWFKDNNITYLKAEGAKPKVEKIKMKIDGKIVEVTGKLEEGYNIVNLREIAPLLGYNVGYDAGTKIPILTKGAK
ncbi:MAG: hypothetical protein LBV08_04455 [Clostridiales bacterium]|jgi:hypothetical protein|nr:hypothetical protein [Clostridiales bacterium]